MTIAQSASCKGQPQAPGGHIADTGDEAVDTLIRLISIVNRCEINLEDFLRIASRPRRSRAIRAPGHDKGHLPKGRRTLGGTIFGTESGLCATSGGRYRYEY